MKKLNVPDTGGQPTPDVVRALKDNIDVMTGRRGNALALPEVRTIALQTLTFSAPPTQAEVQALNAYVNSTVQALNEYVNAWAVAVRSLTTRFDG